MSYYTSLYPKFDETYARELLARFGLDPQARIKKLSTGNKTLVYNILGLATREKVTIFDEPTNGLDSVNRQKFFEVMLDDYTQEPRLIILSTHLIQEIENYLTHVILLKDSMILMDDAIETIQAKTMRISNARIAHKRVLHERHMGSMTETFVFDTLSDEDVQAVTAQDGTVTYYDLQTLFNYLVEE